MFGKRFLSIFLCALLVFSSALPVLSEESASGGELILATEQPAPEALPESGVLQTEVPKDNVMAPEVITPEPEKPVATQAPVQEKQTTEEPVTPDPVISSPVPETSPEPEHTGEISVTGEPNLPANEAGGLPDDSPTPEALLTPEPPVAEETPMPTEEILVTEPPKNEAPVSQEPASEGAIQEEMTPEPTFEAPAAINPAGEELVKEEPAVLPTEEPVRTASKTLPAKGPSGGAKTASLMMARAVSFSVWVDQSTYYFNLNKEPGTPITWTAYPSGGSGYYVYAFDLYKDGELIQYMSSYQYSDTFTYTPYQAGNYHVRAYVYDWDNWREMIVDSDETGVSNLQLLGVTTNTTTAQTGDTITFTVNTQGGTGEMEFSYYLYVTDLYGSEYLVVQSPGYVFSNTFTYTVSTPGQYALDVVVWENDITNSFFDSHYISGYLDVALGEPTMEVYGVFSDWDYYWMGDTIDWYVQTGFETGYPQFKFQVYTGNILLEETTSWSSFNTYSFTPGRTGRYHVVATVRDSAFPDKEYTLTSSAASVSDLYVDSFTPNKTVAYLGDTVTWAADIVGGSGNINSYFSIYLNDSYYDFDADFSGEGTLSYIVTELGYYDVQAEIYDAFSDMEIWSDSSVTVKVRPAPVISSVATVSGTSVKVSWGAVSGATGYELQRATNKAGPYTTIYTGAARAFTSAGLKAGVPYYYRVRSYKTVNTDKYYGLFSAVKIGVPLAKPVTPTGVVSSKTSVTLSWTAVAGASGYEVWRSTSAAGTYTRVYRGTARNFKNISLRTGTTYYYKIRAYKLVGTTSFYSPYSSYRAIRPQ